MFKSSELSYRSNPKGLPSRDQIASESLNERAIKSLARSNAIAQQALLGFPEKFANGTIPPELTEAQILAMYSRIDRREAAIQRLGG